MWKKRVFLVATATFWLTCLSGESPAHPQRQLEGGGIPYGDKIGAVVGAPKEWIFDVQSGVSQGLPCVMYPKGSSWRTAGEVMYVSFASVEPSKTFADFITEDAASFLKKAPGMEITTVEPITLTSGEEAQVRKFAGDTFDNHECVAYAQRENSVAIFVLSCRSKDGYEQSLGLFKEMVSQSILVNMDFGHEPADTAEAAPKFRTSGLDRPMDPLEGLGSGAYSFWCKFKPQTYVAFRYSMNSGQGSQDMLKTVTLKRVTPDTVYLECQESPYLPPTKPTPESSNSIYQKALAELRQADEEFHSPDPFASVLGFDITRFLKDPQAAHLGSGQEKLTLKGGKFQTAWTKLGFGTPDAQMTVTVWKCDTVPGRLFKFVKELKGTAAFREEVSIESFNDIAAEPADLERLRASRTPSLVEVRADSYIMKRFRYLESLSDLAIRPRHTLVEAPSSERFDLRIAVDYQEHLLRIKNELNEDSQKALAELGPEEMAKLKPFLDQAESLLKLALESAGKMVQAIESMRHGSIDEASPDALQKMEPNIFVEVRNANQQHNDEFRKLRGTTVKFLKNPR